MFLPIIWGEKIYGIVDRVPGVFYVATMFFHLYWFPLVPMRTYVVLDIKPGYGSGSSRRSGIPLLYSSSETTFAAVPAPWSHRSMWLAWAQVVLLLVWALGGTITLVLFVDSQDSTSTYLMLMAIPAVALALWLYLMIIPGRRLPSYERACELGRMAGITSLGWQRLNKAYGRPSVPTPAAVVDPQADWAPPIAKPPVYETPSLPEPAPAPAANADDDPLAQLAQLTRPPSPRPPSPRPVPPSRQARGR